LAGQHDDVVGHQVGNEYVAQPSVDRGELLVAVDEQDDAGHQPRRRLAVVLMADGEADRRTHPFR
jgi:hypothetical protein